MGIKRVAGLTWNRLQMRVDNSTRKGTSGMDKFSSKVYRVHMELGGKLLNSLRIKTQFLERLQSVSVANEDDVWCLTGGGNKQLGVANYLLILFSFFLLIIVMMQTHVATLLLGTSLFLTHGFYTAVLLLLRHQSFSKIAMGTAWPNRVYDSKFLPNVRINRRAVMMIMLVWFLEQVNIRNED